MKLLVCVLSILLYAFVSAGGAEDIFDVKAANSHIKQGRKLMQKKKYDKAVAEFEEALKINPDSAEASYLTGYSRYRQRRMEEAYKGFSSAYESDRNYAPRGAGQVRATEKAEPEGALTVLPPAPETEESPAPAEKQGGSKGK